MEKKPQPFVYRPVTDAENPFNHLTMEHAERAAALSVRMQELAQQLAQYLADKCLVAAPDGRAYVCDLYRLQPRIPYSAN